MQAKGNAHLHLEQSTSSAAASTQHVPHLQLSLGSKQTGSAWLSQSARPALSWAADASAHGNLGGGQHDKSPAGPTELSSSATLLSAAVCSLCRSSQSRMQRGERRLSHCRARSTVAEQGTGSSRRNAVRSFWMS